MSLPRKHQHTRSEKLLQDAMGAMVSSPPIGSAQRSIMESASYRFDRFATLPVDRLDCYRPIAPDDTIPVALLLNLRHLERLMLSIDLWMNR